MSRPFTPIPPEICAQIDSLYALGTSLRRIGDLTGVERRRAMRYLRRRPSPPTTLEIVAAWLLNRVLDRQRLSAAAADKVTHGRAEGSITPWNTPRRGRRRQARNGSGYTAK